MAQTGGLKVMQLFGTSFNMDLGSFRLHISFGLDERDPEPPKARYPLPALELVRPNKGVTSTAE
jgi:hypothetical protein